jgi:hypothetical protein
MNAYYQATQIVYNLLIADPDVNTVTKGDITKIDLNKKNIYPLCHLNVYDAGFTTSTLEFGVVVFAMSLRNESKEIVTDKFVGNDNEDDNLNSMLYVLARLYLQLVKFGGDFTIKDFQRPEPFTEARTNVVDGWAWRFTLELPLDLSGC